MVQYFGCWFGVPATDSHLRRKGNRKKQWGEKVEICAVSVVNPVHACLALTKWLAGVEVRAPATRVHLQHGLGLRVGFVVCGPKDGMIYGIPGPLFCYICFEFWEEWW